MSGTSNLWDKSMVFMTVLGNIVLLQLVNMGLFITGLYMVAIPIIIIMSSAMIYNYIYEGQKFTISSYIDTFKEQFGSMIVYGLIINVAYMSVRYGLYIQDSIQAAGLNPFMDLAVVLSSSVLMLSLFIILLYFPLISVTTEQDIITKIKVSIMMPFFSFKLLMFIIFLSVINFMLFTNNFLFLILLGPIPLLASNIIVFKNNINKAEEN